MSGKARVMDLAWRFIPVAFGALGLYVALSVKLATLELRVDTIENNHLAHVQTALEKIDGKMDEITEVLTDVRLQVTRLEQRQ